MTLGRNLELRKILYLPTSQPPALLVVIDTEEEFDWSRDFDREAVGVDAFKELWRTQQVFEEYGIKPTYVVDYPVATTPTSVDVLADFLKRGAATIGIQLHPWVNPPHDEPVCRRNSYQGNLAPELERQKLMTLTTAVSDAFHINPAIHKAGRYGFGQETAQMLLDLSIEIDLSVAPSYNFSADGGPDYSRIDANAYRLGPDSALLGIPTTGGFIGALSALGPRLYSTDSQSSAWGRLGTSVLSKTRHLERILLSPEGHSLDKMKRLTRVLYARGLRVFTLSLHSPTVKPGCTPYTSTEQDVAEFLCKCRHYVDFFFDELGGTASTPFEVRDMVTRYDGTPAS
jgi:hypothetical protein